MSSLSEFGLLLDVDGPISNPDAKQILQSSIIPSLISLLNQGIPVVFNTGRADAFVRERVLAPLLAASQTRVDRLHAVCEKGAVWLSIREDRTISQEVDADIAVPKAIWEAFELLVKERFSDTMFFDYDKRTMISVERNLHTSHDDYIAAQPEFIEAAFDLMVALGFGVQWGDRRTGDASGAVPYQIDVTIIAVDVESVVVGKDLGASRAFSLLARDDSLPKQWRTVGDSGTDYAMAQWLFDGDFIVKHVDVRGPDHKTPATDFEVLRPRTHTFDRAGADYLKWLVAHIAGSTIPEDAFET